MVIDKIVDSGLIRKDQFVILGFSGGPDSLCLLHALVQIAEPYNLTIIPVHVNHMLRPSAQDEASRAVRMCEVLDLGCEVYEADCEQLATDLNISTEEAGRIIRYEIFDEVANNIMRDANIDPDEDERVVIAVAHNADDQSETVLFRLLRGTGSHGLAGMPAKRGSDEGFSIVRPLLKVSRAEVEQYIKENKLHPNMDESNETTEYTRNKIRNELIPYLEENFNPNIKEALRRYAEIADQDDGFLEDLAYGEMEDKISADSELEAIYLQLGDLDENPPAVNTRIIGIILKSLNLDTKSSYELVNGILSLIYSDNPSAVVDMPNGFHAIRDYGRIIFSDNPIFLEKTRPRNGLALLPHIVKKKEFKAPTGEAYAAFDFDEFNKVYPGQIGQLKLRTRQEGDFIAINGGSKKIQDLFVDLKVKKNDRESILMACIDDEVLWILPNAALNDEVLINKGKFSHNFQIQESSERVLFLEVEEKIC